jgi:hypothetical protein
MNKKYDFDKELKRAVVRLYEKGKCYSGVAQAHENDLDIASEKTGLTIANARAYKDMHTRKAKACANEIARLQKQIDHYGRLQSHHLMVASQIDLELEEYLSEKENFAKNLRKMRSKRSRMSSKEDQQ